MTNYFWTGAADTDSTNASNWTPSAVPGAGDVVIFDNQATQDCFWQHTATGASITVDEMILEDSFQYVLRLQTVPTIKGMFLNKNIRDGSANSIKFASGPISSGGYKTYGSKYVLIGDNVVYTNGRQNLTFEFNATAVCAFDDGQHPKINLTGGNFTPKYTTPTGTSDKTDFYQLEIDAGCTLTPDVSISTNDKNKKFKFASQTTTQFVCNIATVNWGSSTVEFTGVTSSTFNLPVSTTTNYNSGDFFAQYRKVILTADTAGYRIDMQDNTFLSVEEFEIGDGLLFVGPRALNAQGSDIRTILPPKIRGSWSFSSISDGIYRSPRQASGPMPKVQGNFHITGKLDVDGLIDPTGLELNPQGSNPGGVAANTLWLNSGDSNKLYHGSSEVGGGGGGGGDITAVNTNAPITGGATSGAVTLSLSASSASAAGSMSSAHYSKLEGIEASADVTDTANVTSAGALMDSEVDADIKTLSLPASTTISTYGKSLVDDADASAARTTLGLGTAATTAASAYATAAQGAKADSAQQPPSEGAFVNGDKTKLDTIETDADVTDTANVTAAGALMDSEVTNLADVKAFDPADYATAAQGTTANNALPKAGGTMSGNITMAGSQTVDGRDLSVDGAKLDGIEASADVTDTANVTAAGALMDSEVTNLAFVKGLQSGISDGNVITANAAVANDDFLRVDGSKVEGRSAAEVRSDLNVADGATAYTDGDAIGAVTPLINNNTVLINTNTAEIAAVTAKASKCFVYLSGNQSYSSGAAKIGHDTALWNVGSNYDLTAEYYVAPRDGYYLVACSFYFTSAPSWAMSLIYVDENAGAGFAIRIRRLSANGQDNMISAVIKLNTGDKVAHYAHASSSKTIGAALNTLTYFSVTEMI